VRDVFTLITGRSDLDLYKRLTMSAAGRAHRGLGYLLSTCRTSMNSGFRSPARSAT
jgi:hypothetical protein